MRQNIHEQARQFIALSGTQERLSDAEQSWLRAHIEECVACRNYEQAAGTVAGALRSLPLDADFALMRVTQTRVRSRAVELRRRQERNWLGVLSCLLVGFSAATTTPLFWRAFEWIGVRAHLSNSVWQTAFALFWMLPALVASAVLLGRGTHLSEARDLQWK